MYHVGRPGEDGYANRVLQAWGLDGHNSHTNVCSASARLATFSVDRRRSAVARSRERADDSAAVVASRVRPLFQSARAADHRRQVARRAAHRHRSAPVEHVGQGGHVAAGESRHRRRRCFSRSRAHLLDTGRYNREFVRRWVNWDAYLEARAAGPAADVRVVRSGAEAGVRAVHAGVRRGRNRRAAPRR